MNFGQASQSSQSKQVTGLRGTPYESAATSEAYNAGKQSSDLTTQLMSSPGAMMNYGRQMIPGGKYGLGENADIGVEALGKYAFGLSSGEGAYKGQLSPENISSVTGAAIQNTLPFLIPQLQQFQLGQFMAPQQLQQVALNNANYWNRALGGQAESTSSGQSTNFGFLSSSSAEGLIGAAAGVAAASHPDYKEDITPVTDEAMLDAVLSVPIYRWRYKGQPDTHLGGLTTEMPVELVTADGRAIDIVSYLGALTGAVKALAKQVQHG